MTKPELFDVVELWVNLPEAGLQVGAQGPIVEQYAPDSYEVEFVNESGETIVLVVLKISQFVIAWQAQSKLWVPISERLQALVVALPEDALLEVFDFARFVHSRRIAS